MRKKPFSYDYILCYTVNLGLNFEWGILSLILWLLHLWLGIPEILYQIGIGIWMAISLFTAVLMSLGAKSDSEPRVNRKNLNPYSAKNPDFIDKPEKPDENEDEAQVL